MFHFVSCCAIRFKNWEHAPVLVLKGTYLVIDHLDVKSVYSWEIEVSGESLTMVGTSC